jgi:F0F1-type ATP synthase membrane subunit c/vacuolar-type H+-ATPase subunit K
MITLATLLCYLSGSICMGIVVITIAIAQKRNIVTTEESIKIQPASHSTLFKYLVLSVSTIESPLVFSSIAASFVIFAASNILLPQFSISCLFYFTAISIISSATAYACGHAAKNYLRSLSAHFSLEGFFSQKLIVALSLLQTPLLFSLILIWLHTSLLQASFYNDSLNLLKILLSSSLCLMMAFASTGVLIGMGKIVKKYGKICIFFPEDAQTLSTRFFLMLGLVEAPIIFPFIINFILLHKLSATSILFTLQEYSLSIILPIFGIIVGFVSRESGTMVAHNFQVMIKNENIKKTSISLTFLSQILLDARILYAFLVIILCILKMKLI